VVKSEDRLISLFGATAGQGRGFVVLPDSFLRALLFAVSTEH